MPLTDLQPQSGEQIRIHGDIYTFPAASGRLGGVPYEVGKAARVYQLTHAKGKFALKAFFDHYRNPLVGQNSAALAKYSHLPGLTVAKRQVVTPEKHTDLVKKFPTFAHAVLMPWTTGESWANYVGGAQAISPENSLTLARAMAEVLSGLEQNHVAHCDISSGNFVFSPDFKHVELVDIEEMFAEGLTPPHVLPVGTEGYALETVVQNGYHNADADRFAGAILLVEILLWQFADVRAAREAGSLFASSEFGHKSKRYKLAAQRLQELPDAPGLDKASLGELFERVWFARWADRANKVEHASARDALQACPSLQEWRQALGSAGAPVSQPVAPPVQVLPPVLSHPQFGMPRLQTDTGLLDFGVVGNTARRLRLQISNAGSGLLTGSVSALPWLIVSPGPQFAQTAGQKTIELEFSLAKSCPTRESGGLLRFPGAVILNTNGGTKVVGVQFRVEEKSLMKKLFG